MKALLVAIVALGAFFALGFAVVRGGEPAALFGWEVSLQNHSTLVAWWLTWACYPQALLPVGVALLLVAWRVPSWRARIVFSVVVLVCVLASGRPVPTSLHAAAPLRLGRATGNCVFVSEFARGDRYRLLFTMGLDDRRFGFAPRRAGRRSQPCWPSWRLRSAGRVWRWALTTSPTLPGARCWRSRSSRRAWPHSRSQPCERASCGAAGV